MRPAILSGLPLAQTSEFSLVVGLQGMIAGQIDPSTFTVITLVALITMTVMPFLASDLVALRRCAWKGPPVRFAPDNSAG